jgi:putative nucleotidyltransferase with HDIG domain
MEQGTPLIELINERMRRGDVVLPVFDQVALRLYEAVRDDRMTGDQLAALLEADPVLASEVLRAANSSFFAGLGNVTRLRDAVVRMGARHIANLAMAASQKRIYSASTASFKRYLVDLWRHAYMVACGSRWLARKLGLDRLQDEAFLAGLLHDVGKLSILRVLEELVADGECPVQVSRAILDAALRHLHTVHGAELLAQWNIPESLRVIALHHHDESFDPTDSTMLIVRLVNRASHLVAGPQEDEGDTVLENAPEALALRLNDIMLAELQVVLEDVAAEPM